MNLLEWMRSPTLRLGLGWVFVIGVFSLLASAMMISKVHAEPWISTKMAQNCAGCHAPGRRNLPAKERRCSLSCQGCHVNPNGGGMRSHYGKWTENQWLHSYRSQALRQGPTVAPFKQQKYAVAVKRYKSQIKTKIAKHPSFVTKGAPIVWESKDQPDPDRYGRKDDPYHDKLGDATSRKEQLFHIPDDDPYRKMLVDKVDGGADIRLATIKKEYGTDKNSKSFLMSADFGIRWRPVYKRYHLVYESRHLGSPTVNALDKNISPGTARSFYFLVDDLPYNTFVMGGYYRPLFGHYVADHYALSQVMQGYTLTGGSSYNLQYKAVSIGTAPNVPYANIHLIGKNMRASDIDSNKHQGLATNLGMRFVSYGASVNYSFWTSEDTTNSDYPIKIVMHSLHLAATVADLLVSLEGVSFERDDLAHDFRQGGVITLDLKWRFWRETYATLEYASANTTETLTPGSAKQLKYGFKHFLLPGWEMSLQYNEDDFQAKDAESDARRYYIAMMHMYY